MRLLAELLVLLGGCATNAIAVESPGRSLVNHALAVDHLTDWDRPEWWLHYLGAIAVPLLATLLVVAAYRTFQAITRTDVPDLLKAALSVALAAGAFAVAFLGLSWHIELLYATLRHTSTATRAVLAGLSVAALNAVASAVVAVGLGASRQRLAVIALACTVPAVFSVVGDGLNRAASAAAVQEVADAQRRSGVLPRSPPAPGQQLPTRAADSKPPATVHLTKE